MADFFPVFLLILIASAAVSVVVTLVFARLEGAPPVINIRQRCKDFLALPFQEQVRLGYLAAFAVLFGGIVCSVLAYNYPALFGYPVVTAFVFSVTVVMAKITIFTSSGSV
jgi:hypothetical protein